MEYRRLGKSGLKVSEIALGSWLTYGTVTEKERAIACVKQAYELGINHFDCANVYGAQPHAAEEVMQEALKPYARDSYVITTKAFWPVGDGPNDRGLSRKHIMAQVEKSLKALGVDYIDIFYFHRFDPDTDLEESLRALDDLITQGKVLYGGLSEWPADKIAAGVSLQKELQLHKFAASQPIYNMFERYIEQAVIPICEDAGIGQVVFSPLAQGVLTGKYRKGAQAPEGSRAATPGVNRFLEGRLTEDVLDKVEQLSAIATKAELSLPQLALAWVLRQPNVASALIGASRPEQVVENVKASGITLNEDILHDIEAVLA
ncbi:MULTISPECIES: aldo/keto reductase family protein [Alicyclobacillus]|uniref:Aldo/keto reductase family protein n=1 Tax=Alicyclobacillus acidoterrestris (strain ATCC 49025 / DSM 3922 / CIP 106132 / NCIMB 13137 / GD3B) TaxID=1356854 RepID=T0CXN5_ALIAG|nr:MULTISPECIES: aldo/keto reductase family protein [Alicyclobacillus]EPZ42291.1 voltage-gated potassium channel [Alicyclobacillus acidoterrestris ATCC 49025]UNO48121.1 aldo/keto reductase family protein [Alicyclobacillus acidoterrestris]GEO26888.1 aldo/keto reductase [Alicyclobacillus acidoterrestris]